MNKKSPAYRFISACVLMLFISSVALPSGVSAASLFCDMPMAEMHNSMDHCCEVDEKENTAHHRDISFDSNCNSEKICLHFLSPNPAEVEAVVIQQAKKFTVAATFADLFFEAERVEVTSALSQPITIPDSSPPIFILNSSFLN